METELDRLIATLSLIAAPAVKQIEWLAKLGHFQGGEADISAIDGEWNIDEIGLQFDDVEIFLPGLLERGEISASQLECVGNLGTKMSQLSGIDNLQFWTVNAIRTNPEWSHIRGLARECLNKFGYSVRL